MREYDPQKDSIGLSQLNEELAIQLNELLYHISKTTTHVSVEDRNRWDSKLEYGSDKIATYEVNGLMSSFDKKKLDLLPTDANNYVHPESTVLTSGTYNTFKVDQCGHIVEASNEAISDAKTLDGVAADKYAKLESPLFTGTPLITNTPDEDNLSAIVNVRFVRDYVDKAIKNLREGDT